jgi:hypothetical protein
MSRIAGVVALCVVAVGCSATAPDVWIPSGRWSGIGIQLDVTQQGATIEYGCAHGTIDEPLIADADGRFSAVGVHFREHGGPVRVDEPSDRHPARYDGRLAGTSMRLTVTTTDAAQVVGTFDLTYGGVARVVKCL